MRMKKILLGAILCALSASAIAEQINIDDALDAMNKADSEMGYISIFCKEVDNNGNYRDNADIIHLEVYKNQPIIKVIDDYSTTYHYKETAKTNGKDVVYMHDDLSAENEKRPYKALALITDYSPSSMFVELLNVNSMHQVVTTAPYMCPKN